jgi:hypothetical protein
MQESSIEEIEAEIRRAFAKPGVHPGFGRFRFPGEDGTVHACAVGALGLDIFREHNSRNGITMHSRRQWALSDGWEGDSLRTRDWWVEGDKRAPDGLDLYDLGARLRAEYLP